ncbi:MAG TPA: hypothetical protein VGN57_08550 [Pirellulaceae bacterium]|jgi:hypothetical protein|nr:hypothetical protein [Pirellulaceae bacterium]
MFSLAEFTARADQYRTAMTVLLFVAVGGASATGMAAALALVAIPVLQGHFRFLTATVVLAPIIPLPLFALAAVFVRSQAISRARELRLECPTCGGRIADVRGHTQSLVLASRRCFHGGAPLSRDTPPIQPDPEKAPP